MWYESRAYLVLGVYPLLSGLGADGWAVPGRGGTGRTVGGNASGARSDQRSGRGAARSRRTLVSVCHGDPRSDHGWAGGPLRAAGDGAGLAAVWLSAAITGESGVNRLWAGYVSIG